MDRVIRKLPKKDPRQFVATGGSLNLAFRTSVAALILTVWFNTPGRSANQGGRDLANIASHPKLQVVAICDIDTALLDQAGNKYPDARRYTDWREMLEKEGDKIDTVNVGTPDHMHAPISISAMQREKHVFCEKPLTHQVAEARRMAEVADKQQVITQMGNQIHSHIAYRMGVAWLQSGVIGKVKEVHSWVGAKFPQQPAPAQPEPIPETLNWDHWIGVAPERHYNKGIYHPFNWRGWQDFGGGAIGDFGCHILDPVFTALELTAPTETPVDTEAAQKHAARLATAGPHMRRSSIFSWHKVHYWKHPRTYMARWRATKRTGPSPRRTQPRERWLIIHR